MKSIINLTEEQHQQKLQQRHLRGTIHEYIYRGALLLAIFALLALLIQITNQAFGPVLVVPVVPPAEFTDKPLDDLTNEEMSEILVDQLGAGYLNLVRDNFGRMSGVAFVEAPLREAFNANVTFPGDIDPDTLSFADLNKNAQAKILELNATENQLRNWIIDEIIGEDVILEWSWLTGIFKRNQILNESAEELAGGIARTALRAMDDDFTAEALAPEIVSAVGEENALSVVADYFTTVVLIETTAWDIEKLRDDVTLTLNETNTFLRAKMLDDALAQLVAVMVSESLINEGIAAQPAKNIATALVDDVIDLTDATDPEDQVLGGAQRITVLSALMIPPFENTLNNNRYPDAKVEFRSWLDGEFLLGQGVNSVPELASLRVAVLGSVWVMIITMITAFPIGVGAAIYLEEYATDNWVNNLIEINIRNLAGVPSIIYGLLGLAVFVRAMGLFTSGLIFSGGAAMGETLNGRTVMSAGLTLALLILPVIIINSQEAIRSVSSTIREASYGLGATKWQTIWRQVLPAAIPGILTGTILSFSRAVGETAPLIVVGAASSISVDPSIFSKFTVIPIQIFQWTEESRPEYQHLAAAAIIVLLVLLVVLNSTAIFLRNRYSKA